MSRETHDRGILTGYFQQVGPITVKATEYVYVFLGNIAHSELGGGSLVILRQNNDGKPPTILKRITALVEEDDITSRFILPAGSQISVAAGTLVGAMDVFAEVAVGTREGF
jgi:hypothetical protein